MKELTIPFEIADGITLATLQEQRSYLKEEIRLHIEEGRYMHPEDYHNSMTKLIPAMELLIEYYGGDISDPLE
jgi:hypothetical protein